MSSVPNESLVQVGWNRTQTCLIFTFPEYLTKQAAAQAIKEWNQHFAVLEGKATLVWDCSELRDFDAMARVFWQNSMIAHRAHIANIYMVSGSRKIRTVAKLLGLVIQMPIVPLKGIEELAQEVSEYD